MKKALSATLSALLLISLAVAGEWFLLTGSTPHAVVAAIVPPTPSPVPARPFFQTGVVFPRWGLDAYGQTDANYPIGLRDIKEQTGARWIELTVNLYQPSYQSTQVVATQLAPTPTALAQGIRAARAMGFHVFVAPLITVGTSGWAGAIRYHDPRLTAQWFDNYWKALEPYVVVASDAGAEQFAVGTEMFLMERWASSALWNKLIARARASFSGALTYDMNFTSVGPDFPDWFMNPELTYLGVSEYTSLMAVDDRLEPAAAPALWRANISVGLDAFARLVGKPIVISEIGYTNSANTFYRPYRSVPASRPDPEEQAAGYNAALQNVLDDPYIVGIYFWGWSIPDFAPNWLPAQHMLHHWYTSSHA